MEQDRKKDTGEEPMVKSSEIGGKRKGKEEPGEGVLAMLEEMRLEVKKLREA